MAIVGDGGGWMEGSYLLPDTVHGTAYLEAVRDVLGPAPEPGARLTTTPGSRGRLARRGTT